MNDDITFRTLHHLQHNPQLSQRELAGALGVSLGQANYCLRALIGRGLVKVENFRRSNNKLAYSYLLTPQGVERKARLMARFLKRKEAEYQALRAEIKQLRAEAADAQPDA